MERFAELTSRQRITGRNALAERDSAVVALGDNPCWNDFTILLSRSLGEGLPARMMKDEVRGVLLLPPV